MGIRDTVGRRSSRQAGIRFKVIGLSVDVKPLGCSRIRIGSRDHRMLRPQ